MLDERVSYMISTSPHASRKARTHIITYQPLHYSAGPAYAQKQAAAFTNQPFHVKNNASHT